MTFTLSRLLSILFLCSLFVSAKGQGCCSGGAPLSGNLNLSPIESGVFSLRLIYDLNNLGSVIAGNERLNDRTRTRLTQTGLLKLDYEFRKRWAVSALFSYVRQVEEVNFGTIANQIYGQGLGDMVLIGSYHLLNKSTQKFSLGMGAKLPTGSINKTNQQTSLLLPPDLQPGTGGWDFVAIAQYTERHLFLIRNLGLTTNVTYRYTTAAARFERQQLYKFGNILQAAAGFNYRLLFKKLSFTPQASLRYRYSLADQTDGFPTINTGGHWMYLIGGTELAFNKNLSLMINTEIPVLWRLEGVQLTTSYKLTFGLVYNFFKEKSSAK